MFNLALLAPLCQALPPHPRLQTSYLPSVYLINPCSAPSLPFYVFGCFSTPPATYTSPDSLRVFPWSAGGLRARSDEILHFLSLHPADLICIQESNLNSSSSVRNPVNCPLPCDSIHFRSGIITPDGPCASGGVTKELFLAFFS